MPSPKSNTLNSAANDKAMKDSKLKRAKATPRAQTVPLPLDIVMSLIEAAEAGTDTRDGTMDTSVWHAAIGATKKRVEIYRRLS